MKRENYISYTEMFISMAAIVSYRSKDPNTQNGCIITDPSNRVLSIGYNGLPSGCSDDEFPWTSPAKYDYAEHAERNAIYNAGRSGIPLFNCTLYLYSERGYYPCSDCARAIIQAGIKKVILGHLAGGDISESGKYNWEPSRKMFKSANIKVSIIDDSSEIMKKIHQQLEKSSQIINDIKIRNDRK